MYHSNPSVVNCYHFLWAELWTVESSLGESGFQGDACLANKMS